MSKKHDNTNNIAVVLSFLIMGLGQMYKGHIWRGLGIMLGGFVLLFLTFGIGTFLLWLWNIFDAYNLEVR